MIKKLLIANRGEIAVRVMRAARELGIRTVAVASEADAEALHAQIADDTVLIGPPEPAASYLRADRLIEVARETGADAVHPGYGFLSERASFAEACREAGLIFVGPSPEAMRSLGSKIDAKQLAVAAGVPIAPGFFEPGASVAQLREAADQIGYPVMLKASAGGGGRGMRVVRDPADFERELALASEEALAAFGDGAMMVEKFVERPRHVEVQVIADGHGHVAALFERDCSVQRRHQKLIEEAPSPAMTPDLWQRMREAAVGLIARAGYENAGTVEFMVDGATGEFYFLEVNARLQVEHPVTEELTGVDLVKAQLRVAAGEPIGFGPMLMGGDRAAIRGHVIEARVVAEDASHGFLPSIGKVFGWAEPRGPGIRVDSGFMAGSEVTRFYDSLLAKVIVTAETRGEAIARLRGALLDFHILGVKTNIPFLLAVLEHPRFVAGEVDTGWVGRELANWSAPDDLPSELGSLVKSARGSGSEGVASGSGVASAWSADDAWRVRQV